MGFPILRGQMTVYQQLISLKLFLTNGHILSIYSATRSLPTLAPLVDATLTSKQLAQQWKLLFTPSPRSFWFEYMANIGQPWILAQCVLEFVGIVFLTGNC